MDAMRRVSVSVLSEYVSCKKRWREFIVESECADGKKEGGWNHQLVN